MSGEQPEARHGRSAVFVLVAAILIATALAIALVARAASQSGSADDVLVLGAPVTNDTPQRNGTAPGDPASTAARAASPCQMSCSTGTTVPSSASIADPEVAPVTVPTPTTLSPEASVAAAVTISVPEIQLDAAVYEGVELSVLDIGPGHWPGTAAPGGFGNLVIAGHRSTSARTFERIGELATGDLIVLADITGTYTYVVGGSDVVAADRLDVVEQAPGHKLTLIAPHPPGSEQYRYVVHARLVSTPRPPGI